MGGRRRVWTLIAVCLSLAVTTACADAARHGHARRWFASWIASPEAAAPGSAFAGGFRDVTIRDIIYTSAGGTLARVRFDNTFGSRALVIGRAALGAGTGQGGSTLLTFAGRHSTVIPPGAQAFSDPVRMAVRPLESLAVSVFLPQETGPPTEHADAKEPNYVVDGDHVLASSEPRRGRYLSPWDFVSGLDVSGATGELGTLVALGDSITNGNGSVPGANGRWPNDLERRLIASRGPVLSIVDAGIEGNRVLNPSLSGGQSALARFDRDVLRQAGVREVIVLEGINDIGLSSSTSPLTAPHTNVSAQQIIAGYQQLITWAHAAGLKIFGATLTPFQGAQHWTPAGEAKRDAINAWIRTSGAFDGVIDFARAVAEPGDPDRLDPRYDDGDHLHMDDAGYQAMANAVNLAMLLRGVK